MVKRPVFLKISEDKLRFLDQMILDGKWKNRNGFRNRGEYIEMALDYYWKLNYGISYMVKK